MFGKQQIKTKIIQLANDKLGKQAYDELTMQLDLYVFTFVLVCCFHVFQDTYCVRVCKNKHDCYAVAL